MPNVTHKDSFGTPAISVLITALFGCSLGAVILFVIGLDTRWIVYFTGAAIFLTIVVAARDQVLLLWIMLLLGLQFNVHFRVLYGYAGSEGLSLAFPTAIGAMLLVAVFFSRQFSSRAKIRLGGPMALPIAFLFATSIWPMLFTREQFVGITELFIYAQYYFLYLLILNYVTTWSRFEITVKLLLIVLTIQALVYYLQSAMGTTFTLTGATIDAGELARPGGTVSTRPAGFAGFMIPLTCIAAAMYVASGSFVRSFWKSGLPALLGSVAILLTFTRAAWASTVLGLSVVAFLHFRRKSLSSRKFSAIVAVAVIAALAAAPGIAFRLNQAPLQESFDERVALMGMAVNVIREHPIAGVGPGAYRYTFKSYLTPEQRKNWLTTVHNQYLIRTAETGIAGGLAWIVFLMAGIRLALKLSRAADPTVQALGIGCAAGVTALCFEMFWDIWVGFPYNALLWLMFGLAGAAQWLLENEKRTETGAGPP